MSFLRNLASVMGGVARMASYPSYDSYLKCEGKR